MKRISVKAYENEPFIENIEESELDFWLEILKSMPGKITVL